MTPAISLFVAWALGGLAIGRLAMSRRRPPVPTVFLAAGATLLLAGAIQFLPGVIEALRRVNFSAPSGPYGDTYYIVGHGHFLISLGLFVLLLAALTLWIALKGGRRTRKLLTYSAALFYLTIGAQVAINFGAIPGLFAGGIDGPDDFAPINLALARVSLASLLALIGILVCSVLTLRRMLQR